MCKLHMFGVLNGSATADVDGQQPWMPIAVQTAIGAHAALTDCHNQIVCVDHGWAQALVCASSL